MPEPYHVFIRTMTHIKKKKITTFVCAIVTCKHVSHVTDLTYIPFTISSRRCTHTENNKFDLHFCSPKKSDQMPDKYYIFNRNPYFSVTQSAVNLCNGHNTVHGLCCAPMCVMPHAIIGETHSRSKHANEQQQQQQVNKNKINIQ